MVSKTCRTTNGKVGIWGNSYPGFCIGLDRQPPGDQGRFTAGTGDRPVHERRFCNTTARSCLANFGFTPISSRRRTRRWSQESGEPFEFGTQDGFILPQLENTAKHAGKIDKTSLFFDQVNNDTFNDYWKSRNIAAHLKNVKAAVLTVGGWFDAEDPQGLDPYQNIKRFNTGNFNALVMGPWTHGGWQRNDGERIGRVSFGFKTAEHFRKGDPAAVLRKIPEGQGRCESQKVNAFETGTNIWRQYPTYAGGRKEANDLLSGQGKPVRAIRQRVRRIRQRPRAGAHQRTLTGVPPGIHGRRSAICRHAPLMLVYQTEVLEEDVTIAGPVRPNLFVSTTGRTRTSW